MSKTAAAISTVLDQAQQEQIIFACAILSIAFGLYNVYVILQIKVRSGGADDSDIEMS